MLEGNRIAIIIGIDKYFDERIPKLPGAKNDASEIYERLRDPNIGNFYISNDLYLAGEDATSYRIRKAINDVFWKADSYDLVLFYFSGHGLVDGYNDGYIAPYDMRLDEPFTYGINMRELRETVSKSANKQTVVIILDCCYSGIATKGDRALSSLSTLNREDLENFYKDHLRLAGKNRIIFASSQADQRSKESICSHSNIGSHPHGSFTFRLIEGIDGKASDEKNGIINLYRLQKYIEENMKIGTDTKQEPVFSVTEARQLEDIRIALLQSKWKDTRDKFIRDIDECCDKKDEMETLFYAVRLIEELKKIDPNNQQIDRFRGRITLSLQSYGEILIPWLTRNSIELRPQITKFSSELYTKLFSLVNFLSFDKFREIDPFELNCLSALCDIINGKIQSDIFIKRIMHTKDLNIMPKVGLPSTSGVV